MSTIEQKEKNLNQLISKLNSLTLTYSQPTYEVEKIKEVPGPEKVVYKEVPKEIVKNEIVYVPLYSVEDGTVLKEKDPKK